MAILYQLGLLLVTSFYLLLLGQASAKPLTAEARREALVKLQDAQGGPGSIIPVDSKLFEKFVIGSPRTYDAVVLLTAASKDYKCQSCSATLEELQVLSSSYVTAQKNDPGSLHNVDAFFFMADYPKNAKVFQKLGFTSVPHLLHFGPTLVEPSWEVGEGQEMPMFGKPQAETMARFFNDRTRARMAITRSQAGATFIMATILLILVLMVKPVITHFDVVLRCIRCKWVWFVVSLGFYVFSISGGVFDLIRKPPTMLVNQRTGTYQIFHSQSMQQYVFEGFIVGGLHLTAAAYAMGLALYTPKLKNSVLRDLLIVLLAGGFLACFCIVLSLYQGKNRWYLTMPM